MKPEKPHDRRIPYEAPENSALRAFRGHLELGEIEAALGVYLRTRSRIEDWRPPPREWVELIQGLVQQAHWTSAISVMLHYDREVEHPLPRVRLKLAQLLVLKQDRPAKALKVLESIPPGALGEPLEVIRRQVENQARRMLDDGVLELGDEL